jgi:hypothetical protein
MEQRVVVEQRQQIASKRKPLKGKYVFTLSGCVSLREVMNF